MKTIEKEVLEWDLTKKQEQYLEVGDVRNCLRVSQRRFYLNALWLFLHVVLFGFLLVSKVKLPALDLEILEWMEVVPLAVVIVGLGAAWGYRLARSQLKEKCLEAMIKAEKSRTASGGAATT